MHGLDIIDKIQAGHLYPHIPAQFFGKHPFMLYYFGPQLRGYLRFNLLPGAFENKGCAILRAVGIRYVFHRFLHCKKI
jgi:hypothetical protein